MLLYIPVDTNIRIGSRIGIGLCEHTVRKKVPLQMKLMEKITIRINRLFCGK